MTSIQKLKRAFASGFTVYAAAQFAGVSAEDARLFYEEEDKRQEGDRPSAEKRKARGRSMDPEEIARVRKMRADGLSYRDIQKDTGFAYATISRYCNGKYYKAPPVETPPPIDTPAPEVKPLPPNEQPIMTSLDPTIKTLRHLVAALEGRKAKLQESIDAVERTIQMLTKEK